ncbi:hypothetical protein K438DRAFT_1988344 [Mycena galopus ATCC 62051]|nr:hypothetical protein K438DRAFT_1988344 [Mycena galopus ATCC 62051]
MNLPPKFPNELWMEVFAHLPPDTHRSLSSTQRALCTLARPLGFTEFKLYPYPYELHPPQAQLADALERLNFYTSPRIAPYVRACTARLNHSRWQGSGSAQVNDDEATPHVLLNAFFARLPKFVALERFYTDRIRFTQLGIANLCAFAQTCPRRGLWMHNRAPLPLHPARRESRHAVRLPHERSLDLAPVARHHHGARPLRPVRRRQTPRRALPERPHPHDDDRLSPPPRRRYTARSPSSPPSPACAPLRATIAASSAASPPRRRRRRSSPCSRPTPARIKTSTYSRKGPPSRRCGAPVPKSGGGAARRACAAEYHGAGGALCDCGGGAGGEAELGALFTLFPSVTELQLTLMPDAEEGGGFTPQNLNPEFNPPQPPPFLTTLASHPLLPHTLHSLSLSWDFLFQYGTTDSAQGHEPAPAAPSPASVPDFTRLRDKLRARCPELGDIFLDGYHFVFVRWERETETACVWEGSARSNGEWPGVWLIVVCGWNA